MEQCDYIVIGGGSAGLASARRAAGHGARVIVIEEGRLGGTCVNLGCGPKKIMWNAAQLAERLEDAADYGFDVEQKAFDWAALKRRRDAHVLHLNEIYARNLSISDVELYRGRAVLEGAGEVRVGERRLRAT